jgi:hypothetical protein
MQEFVNKQLLGWIQEGIEQIREVVQAEQPKDNPFLEQA